MVSCLMGDSTALASAIVRCCLKKHFSSFVKIQLVYNTETGQWEFNYIATGKGEVIGTEKSYKKSLKKIELAFPENKDATKMAASIDFH